MIKNYPNFYVSGYYVNKKAYKPAKAEGLVLNVNRPDNFPGILWTVSLNGFAFFGLL
jgi:hypothetical protein